MDEKSILIFDIQSGKRLGDVAAKHSQDIIQVALNHSKSAVDRFILILDKNRDLFIAKALNPVFKKLASMVDAFAWNDDCDIIYTLADGKSVFWYYPNAVFVDQDILHLTKCEKDSQNLGKNVSCVSFQSTNCLVRRADGAIVSVGHGSPVIALMHEFAKKKQWEQCIKLCRHMKLKELWASLAAMSVYGQDLNTAEVAYAAIDEVHKVQYITQIREIPSLEGKNAELALLRRQPQEAESILLSANLLWRAIKMNIDLFNWDRYPSL